MEIVLISLTYSCSIQTGNIQTIEVHSFPNLKWRISADMNGVDTQRMKIAKFIFHSTGPHVKYEVT
jgi:hypothetical protein